MLLCQKFQSTLPFVFFFYFKFLWADSNILFSWLKAVSVSMATFPTNKGVWLLPSKILWPSSCPRQISPVSCGVGVGFSKSSPKQSSQGNLSVNLGPPRSPSPMFRERTNSPSTAPKSCGLINSCPQPDFPVALSAHSCPDVSWEQRSKHAAPLVLLHSKKRLCGIFGGTVLSQENQFAVISSIPLRRLSLYVHLGSRLGSL